MSAVNIEAVGRTTSGRCSRQAERPILYRDPATAHDLTVDPQDASSRRLGSCHLSSSPARRSGARRPAKVSRWTCPRSGGVARLSAAGNRRGQFHHRDAGVDGSDQPGRPSRGDRRQRIQCALVGGDGSSAARCTGTTAQHLWGAPMRRCAARGVGDRRDVRRASHPCG